MDHAIRANARGNACEVADTPGSMLKKRCQINSLAGSMGEDIGFWPALEIERHAGRQEREA